MPRSLEWQVLVLSSLCLVLSMVGFGFYQANDQVVDARSNISSRMVAMAKNISTISNHFLDTKEPLSIEPLLLQLSTVDGIYSVLVTDPDGKPITEVVNNKDAWSPRFGTAPVSPPDAAGPSTVLLSKPFDARQRDFLEGRAGVMVAWERIGNTLGWVRVSYRMDTFDAIEHGIWLQSASAVLVSIAVTLLLLTLLLRPNMRALKRATEFAGLLDSSLGARLRVSNRSAEIRALGEALNIVSKRLLIQNTDLLNQKFALDQHAIVSISDLQGNITYANQQFCKISGYSEAELMGKNHRIVKSDEHPSAVFDDMWHTISQGQVWHGNVKNRKKDGSFYWVSATIVPLHGPDGMVQQYIGIRTDITANKALEHHLHEARIDAEAATISKSQFLANMSHEIRTPMNAILGMLKLLQNTELNKRQLDYAFKAESAAQSLLGLLNDILDFSKIEAGKMSLEVRPLRLDKVLRDLSVIVSANLGNKPVEILFDIDSRTPKSLLGDILRLQQVLINLAGNAVKFTAKGEVVVGIKVLDLNDTHASLRFSVRDTGIGISIENQNHIFEGFSQAEASTTRRFGGTGLGLSICRRLVALMGGELTLQSTPGKGSTFAFTITLPLAPASVLIENSAQPQNLHVLVVDDNASAREVMVAMVQSLGWQVDAAESGEQAIALAHARVESGLAAYHAMFIDWQMPGMDGWETIARLKTIGATQAPPIVMMVTALGRELLCQRSAEEQARLHGFLVKPVTASMLMDAVAEAMASRTAPTSSAPELVARPLPLKGLRLLVVEDNMINQQVAQEILSSIGAHIEIADNGQIGVDAVHQALQNGNPFDAVLMDIQMPVMDGYEATRVLRKNLKQTDLPIIAMTANAMASDREACLAVGMNDHVGKPFNVTQLTELILSLVKAARTGSRPTQPTPLAPTDFTAKRAETITLPPSDTVDVAGALDRLGGDQNLYVRILQSYLNDIHQAPSQFEDDLLNNKLAEAVRSVHTLKGLSATVGASYLAAVARQIELVLKPALQSATPELDKPALTKLLRQSVNITEKTMQVVAQRCTTGSPVNEDGESHTLSANSLDVPKLMALRVLLMASDMQALEVFHSLESQLKHSHANELQSMHAAINAFDFEKAAKICTQLIELQH
jgi:PAS domain S-box-containing protein